MIEDWFDKIKVTNRSHYVTLLVSDLQVGDYYFNVQGTQIPLKVHDGKWLS